MLTPSLIHLAILAYFSLSSGHGSNIDLHDGQKPEAIIGAKVALDDSTFSESGLDFETAIRPDRETGTVQSSASGLLPGGNSWVDREIVALQSSASGVQSALAWSAQIEKQTPPKLSFASQWKYRFVLILGRRHGILL